MILEQNKRREIRINMYVRENILMNNMYDCEAIQHTSVLWMHNIKG